MPSEIVTTARVERGKLLIRHRSIFDDALAAMKDGEVLVRVERVRAARSLQQNAWYWGCIVQELANHTGYTPDEIHEILKAKFLPKRLAIANGNGDICGEFVLGGSTRQLDTLDFGDYCERIREWAAESLDIVIPDPR